MQASAPLARDERGSTPVEFVLVGALLTALTLGVLQLGLAVYARNVVHDAAVEGAYRAALADVSIGEGARRTEQVVAETLGDGFVRSVSAAETDAQTVSVTVIADLPLVGLFGVPGVWEVTAHAPRERLDD